MKDSGHMTVISAALLKETERIMEEEGASKRTAKRKARRILSKKRKQGFIDNKFVEV
jgi:hypothetical protein